MEVLLVENDPLVRDQVKVGLQQSPEFHVTVGSGHAGINEVRGRHFDCVFLGVDPRVKETVKLLHHLLIHQHPQLFLLNLIQHRHHHQRQ